jgi:hypothetical protein
MSYATTGIPEALAALEQIPGQVRAAASAVPEAVRRTRPEPHTWCVVEYACHLRDVYATYTIRLHRTRTELRPSLEPMLNDLRARRFRYARRDLDAVLDELADNVHGFRDEISRTADAEWDRWPSGCRTRCARRGGWCGRHCTRGATTSGISPPSAERQ